MYIDVEKTINELKNILNSIGTVKEIDYQKELALSWDDYIGAKVRQSLIDEKSRIINNQTKIIACLKMGLQEKECELGKISDTTNIELDGYIEAIKKYDVDPSDYR